MTSCGQNADTRRGRVASGSLSVVAVVPLAPFWAVGVFCPALGAAPLDPGVLHESARCSLSLYPGTGPPLPLTIVFPGLSSAATSWPQRPGHVPQCWGLLPRESRDPAQGVRGVGAWYSGSPPPGVGEAVLLSTQWDTASLPHSVPGGLWW